MTETKAMRSAAIGVLVAVLGCQEGQIRTGAEGTTPIDERPIPEFDEECRRTSREVRPDACPVGAVAMLDNVGYAELAEAIAAARDGDTVWVCPGTWTGSLNIELADTELSLSAVDPTPQATRLVGNGAERVLTVHGGDFILDGVQVEGGRADRGGGLLRTNGNTRLRCSRFVDNHATDAGGAVYAEGAYVHLWNTEFRRNVAAGDGGALALRSADEWEGVVQQASYFFDNEAGSRGGAVWLGDHERFESSRIWYEGNRAALGGGAIATDSGAERTMWFISDAHFIDNHSDGLGGAIELDLDGGYRLSLADTELRANHASSGAAVFLRTAGQRVSEVEMLRLELLGNEAAAGSGAFDTDFVLVSCDECDLGRGDDDNLPDDIVFENQRHNASELTSFRLP